MSSGDKVPLGMIFVECVLTCPGKPIKMAERT